MILFVGQIDRRHRDREAFQEIDLRAVFGTVAKWAAEVETPERLPEYLARAFTVAMSGRPGPVVIGLPEDVISAPIDVTDIPPARIAPAEPSPAQVAEVASVLAGAARPLVVAGGPHWSQAAAEGLARFAAAWDLPVAVSFRRQDRIDNAHPNYVGDLAVGMNPKLGARLRAADVVLALGTRLGDIATGGYELADPARQEFRLIHVHADAGELGRVFRPDPGIAVPAPAMVAALAALPPPAARPWADETRAARAEFEAWQRPVATPGAVKLESVIRHLTGILPPEAILTNGAGNYAAFLHRYHRFRLYGTQLAPTSGSMGYGFPAAVAACLERPGTPVVCLAGDGCFQMTLNEMSTAVQHGAAPVVVVANNGRYGTIRMHQERHYPGRISGTDLANPDFAALARAYGGHGETVTRDEDFPAAFARARAAGVVAVIEVRLDPEMLTTSQTVSQVRGG